ARKPVCMLASAPSPCCFDGTDAARDLKCGTYAVRVATVVPDFTLPRVDGDPVSLTELLADGPVVLVFAHADCPTSTLTLRRLGELDGAARIVCIAEEHPEEAARLARRTQFFHPMLAQHEPYEVSQACGAATVPTAVRAEPGGVIADIVVGWDAEAYERLLGVAFDGEPRSKPGCMARWGYDSKVTGLDELEDMLERGWSDGLPVV